MRFGVREICDVAFRAKSKMTAALSIRMSLSFISTL